MPLKKLSLQQALLLSLLILMCFHVVSFYKIHSRNNIIVDTTIEIPSRVTSQQEAYLAYMRNDHINASTLRMKGLSGSIQQQYNLGTAYAQRSVSSGVVSDYTGLQQAEILLSGAATQDSSANQEILHNLETVRNLLKKQEEQKNDQQQQQSGGSGEQQKQEQEGSKNQQQEGESGSENQQGENSQNGQLSENMKQQLAQYQKQLEGEQAQNQQFFDKRQSENNQNDPFNMLNQVFGGTPQFDQNNNNQGEKDW